MAAAAMIGLENLDLAVASGRIVKPEGAAVDCACEFSSAD